MKVKVTFLIVCLCIALFAGCNRQNTDQGQTTPTPAQTTPSPSPTAATEVTPTTAAEVTPDVITTASIVDNEEAFEAALGTSGTWLIGALRDMTFDKELTLEGEYTNGKKDDDGNDIIQRKIALYTQDATRYVTARFTLTAPKLTINSPKASIEHGTFVGDLYVITKDFRLVDMQIQGNVFFASEEAQSTFTMDEESSVTGNQEIQQN